MSYHTFQTAALPASHQRDYPWAIIPSIGGIKRPQIKSLISKQAVSSQGFLLTGSMFPKCLYALKSGSIGGPLQTRNTNSKQFPCVSQAELPFLTLACIDKSHVGHTGLQTDKLENIVHLGNFPQWHLNLSLSPDPRCTWKEGSGPLFGCVQPVISHLSHWSSQAASMLGAPQPARRLWQWMFFSAAVTTGHYLSQRLHLKVNKCTKYQMI